MFEVVSIKTLAWCLACGGASVAMVVGQALDDALAAVVDLQEDPAARVRAAASRALMRMAAA